MQETSLLESRRYKSRLGFRASPPSSYIPSVMQIIQRNVLTPRFVVSSLKLSREKLLFLLPWWRVSQRATPRRCARAWNRQNTTAWCACTRTRPRSRACVHFHRRARRNCRVAYMQGVKLGSRRFDPRPRIERYREIRCNTIAATRGGQLSVSPSNNSPRFAYRNRILFACFNSGDRSICSIFPISTRQDILTIIFLSNASSFVYCQLTFRAISLIYGGIYGILIHRAYYYFTISP